MLYSDDIPDKIHFSMSELARYVSNIDCCSIETARVRVYRMKWKKELPVIRALGQDRIRRDDLIRFLGLESKDKHNYGGHIYVG